MNKKYEKKNNLELGPEQVLRHNDSLDDNIPCDKSSSIQPSIIKYI